MRICILTPQSDYHERWQPHAALYEGLFGADLTFRPWSSAGDLSEFDLVMPLLAWGYPKQPSKWFDLLDAWEAAGVPFANPVATLRWNTDKDYLLDLQAAGVAIVQTIETSCLTMDDLAAARAEFGTDDIVIKPSISAGADGTYRISAQQPIPFDVLEREMLIQPMMKSIASEGEFSLFHFGGQFSHAILKTPASGDFRVQEQFGGRDVAVDVPDAARALAEAAVAIAPSAPLYARTDMVRDNDGAFRIMELELIEPALFLNHAPDKGALFASAVRAAISAA